MKDKVAPDPSYGNDTNVEGCMPRRGDLDIEFDDDAEETIADIVIDKDDTEEEKELKLQLLQIYDKRLVRREQMTQFIFTRDIIHVDKIEIGDDTHSQEEKELLARIQIFSRLLSDDDFRTFKDAVMSEYKLSNKIHYLKQCRAAGVKRHAEISVYGLESQTRAAQLGNKIDLGWRRPNFLTNPMVGKDHIKLPNDHTAHKIPIPFIKNRRVTQIPPDLFCSGTTVPSASIHFNSNATDNCIDRHGVEARALSLQNLLCVSSTRKDDARSSHKMTENGIVVNGDVSATQSRNEKTSEAVQQLACAEANPGNGCRNIEKGATQPTSECQRSTDSTKDEPQIPVEDVDNKLQTSHAVRGLSVAEARINNSSEPGVDCTSSQSNIYGDDLVTTREALLETVQLQTNAGYEERQMQPERHQKQEKSGEVAAKEHVEHERVPYDSCNSNRHNQQCQGPLQGPCPLLNPMILNGLPDLWKLTPTERKLSSALHIEPTEFLRQRDAMLAQAKYRLHRDLSGPTSGKGSILTLRCEEISQVKHQELAEQEERNTGDPWQMPLNVAPAVPVDAGRRQVQRSAPVFVNEADPLKRKGDEMRSKAETQLVPLPSQTKPVRPSAGERHIPLNPEFTAADNSTEGDKESKFSTSGNVSSQLKVNQKLEPERHSGYTFCPPNDSGTCNNQCSFVKRCGLCIAGLVDGSDKVIEVDSIESHGPVVSSADQADERIRKASDGKDLQADEKKGRHSGSVENDCHRGDKTGTNEMTNVTGTRKMMKVISQWRPLKTVESCTPCQDDLTNVKETVLGGMTEVLKVDENVSTPLAGERGGSNVNALVKVRVEAGIMVIGNPEFAMDVNMRDSYGNDGVKVSRPEGSQKRRRAQHDCDHDRRVKRKRWKRRVFSNEAEDKVNGTPEESAGGETIEREKCEINGDFGISEHKTPNVNMRRSCDLGQTRGHDIRKRHAQEGPGSANSKLKDNVYETGMTEDGGNHVHRKRAGKRMTAKKGLPKVLLQLRLKKPEKQDVGRRRTRAQTRAATRIASERKTERRRGYRTRAVANATRTVIESNDLPSVGSTRHGRKGRKRKRISRSSDRRQPEGSRWPEFAEEVLGDSKNAPKTQVRDLSLSGKGKRNVAEGRQGAVAFTNKINNAGNSKWDVDNAASNVERDEATVRTQHVFRRSRRVGRMRVVEADVDDSHMAVVRRDRMRRACRARPKQDDTDENDDRNARSGLKLLDKNIVWIERSEIAGESNNANNAAAVGTSRQEEIATSTSPSERNRRDSVIDSGQEEDRIANGCEKRYKLRRRA